MYLGKPATTKLAVFDVFDTLLTRCVGDPTSVFYIVGQRAIERGLIGVSASAFRELRIYAEASARVGALGAETTFDEIYAVLAELLVLDPTDMNALKQLELEVEKQIIVPVEPARCLVTEARCRGEHVVFASDMYLPSPFICDLLKRHGFFQNADRLYVSAEHRKSKCSGLFQQITDELKIDPREAVHCGNDPVADGDHPRRLGLCVSPWTEANLNRYEQRTERHAVATDGLASLFAGSSRLARLRMHGLVGREKVLSDIGCSVVAPILTCFVLWTVQRARRRGLRRLYYVSRDGYLLQRMAIRLFGEVSDIEFRYLFGSRHAWHGAAAANLTDVDASWVLKNVGVLTLRIVFARLGVEPKILVEALRACDLSTIEPDRELSTVEVERLWALLTHASPLQEAVALLSGPRRELCLEYLRQEGLYDGVPSGYVDLGWAGNVERSMRTLLGPAASSNLFAMYFGLTPNSSEEIASASETFLFGGRMPTRTSWQMNCLIETFCTAPHGSVVGYSRQGVRISPECRSDQNGRLAAWGHETVHRGVLEFAEILGPMIVERREFPPLQTVADDLLTEFSERPSLSEATAWGSFPFENEQAGDSMPALVPAVRPTLRGLWRTLCSGDLLSLWDAKSQPVRWNAGAYAIAKRAPWWVRVPLRMSRLARSIVRRLKQRFRHDNKLRLASTHVSNRAANRVSMSRARDSSTKVSLERIESIQHDAAYRAPQAGNDNALKR